MGLDTSHDCWHGSYITFGHFRGKLFDAAFGGGPRAHYAYLDEVDAWPETDDRLKDPLMALLLHSDCDGEIEIDKQLALAERLEQLAPKLAEDPDDKTRRFSERAKTFAKGLREAHKAGEPVGFH